MNINFYDFFCDFTFLVSAQYQEQKHFLNALKIFSSRIIALDS
jgi:hypothetical protein